MSKSKKQDRPERRRPLAEINLIGHKSASAKAARRGCLQVIGVLVLAAAPVALALISAAAH